MNGNRISFSWMLPFVEDRLNWAVEMQWDYEDSFIHLSRALVGKFLFQIKSGNM